MEKEQLSLQDVLQQPATVEDLGVPSGMVTDLLLRILFSEGQASLHRFSDITKVSPQALDTVLMHLQQEHIVDIAKAGNVGRASYIYALTDVGTGRARDALDRSQYMGPVPVPIEAYTQAILLQSQERTRIPAPVWTSRQR